MVNQAFLMCTRTFICHLLLKQLFNRIYTTYDTNIFPFLAPFVTFYFIAELRFKEKIASENIIIYSVIY